MGKLSQLILGGYSSSSFRARLQAATRNPGRIRLDSRFRGTDRNRDTCTSGLHSCTQSNWERTSSSEIFGWLVHNPGFTLLEAVIALTLFTILVVIVSLQLGPLLAQTSLHDATRQMVANLQYVRMKAVSQNRRLRVTFRPVSRDYIVDKDEEGTWQRLLLHSHTEEEVAEATLPLPRDVRIVAVNSGGDVIFLPRGAVDGGISVTLGTVSGAETRRVIVNLAGRVRAE